jgi:hypothetical protein
MFWSRYSQSNIRHIRILRSCREPRGLTIIPKPGAPIDPPQTLFDESAVIPLPVRGRVMVIEWNANDIERHLVDL